MKKPKKLNKGDKIATISLSWGGAGDMRHRYEAGKRQLQVNFKHNTTFNNLKSIPQNLT